MVGISNDASCIVFYELQLISAIILSDLANYFFVLCYIALLIFWLGLYYKGNSELANTYAKLCYIVLLMCIVISWLSFSVLYIIYRGDDFSKYIHQIELFVVVVIQLIGAILYCIVGYKIIKKLKNQSRLFFENPLVKMHKMIAILSISTIIVLAIKTILLSTMLFDLIGEWGLGSIYLISMFNCIEPILMLGLLGTTIPEADVFHEANSLKQAIKDFNSNSSDEGLLSQQDHLLQK